MLGERSSEGPLGSPAFGPRGAGYGCWPRCGAACSGTLISPDSCADNGRSACRPAAAPAPSHDKVSDAEAKARADFDIR